MPDLTESSNSLPTEEEDFLPLHSLQRDFFVRASQKQTKAFERSFKVVVPVLLKPEEIPVCWWKGTGVKGNNDGMGLGSSPH
jgi:hypothetical protein